MNKDATTEIYQFCNLSVLNIERNITNGLKSEHF